MSSSTTIVADVSQITADWLQQCLTEYPWAKHISSVNNIEAKQTAISNIAIVALDYSQDATISGPTKLVIKFYLQKSMLPREHIVRIQAYQKEAYFYQYLKSNDKVLPSDMTPNVLYASISLEDQDAYCVIMSYVAGNIPEKRITCEQASMALKRLAQLHGTFFDESKNFAATCTKLQNDGYKTPTRLSKFLLMMVSPNWSTTDMTVENVEAYVHMFGMFWPGFVNVVRNIDISNFEEHNFTMKSNIEVLASNFDMVKDLLREGLNLACNDQYHTLNHCDMERENLVFKDKSVTLLDFQCLSFANPAFDISQLFANCVPFGDLQKHEDELLGVYLANIVSVSPVAEKVVTLAKLKHDYRVVMSLHLFYQASLMFQWNVSDKAALEAHLGRFLYVMMFAVDGILACLASQVQGK